MFREGGIGKYFGNYILVLNNITHCYLLDEIKWWCGRSGQVEISDEGSWPQIVRIIILFSSSTKHTSLFLLQINCNNYKYSNYKIISIFFHGRKRRIEEIIKYSFTALLKYIIDTGYYNHFINIMK